jgi:hypothetical protein
MNMRRNKNIKSFQLQAFGALIVLLITCSMTLAETIKTEAADLFTEITPYVPKPDETFVTESYVHQRWLPYIQEGKVTRKEVIAHLGEPTEYYKKGRIFAYRLLLVEGDHKIIADYYKKIMAWKVEGWQSVKWESLVNERRKALSEKGNLSVFRENANDEMAFALRAREAEYSLILVFDDNNILSKHSLLRVHP